MWYFVVFQPSKCKNHFQPWIWSIWPIFPNDSESLLYKTKRLRNSESAGGSAWKQLLGILISHEWSKSQKLHVFPYITNDRTEKVWYIACFAIYCMFCSTSQSHCNEKSAIAHGWSWIKTWCFVLHRTDVGKVIMALVLDPESHQKVCIWPVVALVRC